MPGRIAEVERFVREIRRRLNRNLVLTLLIHCLCAAGGVVSLIGLFYVPRGQHMPAYWLPVLVISSLAVGTVIGYVKRRSLREAARFADDHFDLDDTVDSYTGFMESGQEGPLYDLQAEQAGALVAKVSAGQVRYRWPLHSSLLCALLLLSSLLMTLKADSPQIATAREKAARVSLETERLNEQVEEALERIREKATTDEMEEFIASDELQEWVERLEETGDVKEAMRQYGGLERTLKQMLTHLEQQRAERLYQEMGEALQAVDQAEALGEALSEGDFAEAAGELTSLRMDEHGSPEAQRQQAERLQAIAERMSEAAQEAPAHSRPAELAKGLAEAVHTLNRAFEASKRKGDSNPRVSAPQTRHEPSMSSPSQPSAKNAEPQPSKTNSHGPETSLSEKSSSHESNLETPGSETSQTENPSVEPSGREQRRPKGSRPQEAQAPGSDADPAESGTKEPHRSASDSAQKAAETPESTGTQGKASSAEGASPTKMDAVPLASQEKPADISDAKVSADRTVEVKGSPAEESTLGEILAEGTETEPDGLGEIDLSRSTAKRLDSDDSVSKVVTSEERDAQAEGTKAVGVEEIEAVNEHLDILVDHLEEVDAKAKILSEIRQLCVSLAVGQETLGSHSAQGPGESPGNAPGQTPGQGEGNSAGPGQSPVPGEGQSTRAGEEPGQGTGEGHGEGKGSSPGEGKGQGKGQGTGEGQGRNDGNGQGSGQGGLEPGWGSSSNINTEKGDAPSGVGERSQLKGIPGQGPTVTKTEQAEEGSGSRSGTKASRLKQYHRQAESFVRREDVSEALKSGVKAYFERIHQMDEGN